MGSPSVGCLSILLVIVAFSFFGFWGGLISIPLIVFVGGLITKEMHPKQYEALKNKEAKKK